MATKAYQDEKLIFYSWDDRKLYEKHKSGELQHRKKPFCIRSITAARIPSSTCAKACALFRSN